MFVVSILMGLGVFFGIYKNLLGMFGMYGVYEVNMVMYNVDLIFGVGVCFDDCMINNLEKYCFNVKIMYIDIDLLLIFKNVKVDLLIVGFVD